MKPHLKSLQCNNTRPLILLLHPRCGRACHTRLQVQPCSHKLPPPAGQYPCPPLIATPSFLCSACSQPKRKKKKGKWEGKHSDYNLNNFKHTYFVSNTLVKILYKLLNEYMAASCQPPKYIRSPCFTDNSSVLQSSVARESLCAGFDRRRILASHGDPKGSCS